MSICRLVVSSALLTLFAACTAEKPTPAKTPESAQTPDLAPKADAPKTDMTAGTETTPAKPDGEEVMTGDAPKVAPSAAGQVAAAGLKVLETMNSGGYTYALLQGEDKREWYAVPECALEVDDQVTVAPGAMMMSNFASATLGRTFDAIYFASGLKVAGAESVEEAGKALMEQAHAKVGAKVDAADADAASAVKFAKPEGGVTVAEIWALGAKGAGKEITFRGKVVKYNGGILGSNWLHVQDGSGTGTTNDITVTTSGSANVGDTVLVKGTLSADRDFGAGYIYELIVENATVTVE